MSTPRGSRTSDGLLDVSLGGSERQDSSALGEASYAPSEADSSAAWTASSSKGAGRATCMQFQGLRCPLEAYSTYSLPCLGL